MDSDKSDEDSNAISKQILDYYKKYSQNRDLPKYFSGTSLSYMPPIVKEDEIAINQGPAIIIEDVSNVALIEKQPEEPVVLSEAETEAKVASPTSSITSTRKLEWDNGADIGYNNCDKKVKLHKSISLPILIGPTNDKNIDKTSSSKLSSQIVTVISYTTPEDNICHKQVDSSSSSSSSPYQAEVPVVESSSSSFRTEQKPISSSSSSFTNTMVYLKNKIGSPYAESTPKLGSEIQKMYIETPFAPKVTKVKNKTVNLCVTKPILVDCLDNKKKKVVDKKSQTSLQGVSSKCVQTGDSLRSANGKCDLSQKPVTNQSIIIINYNDESDKKTCSSYTQSDADVIASQCDSFEYYRNNNFKNELKGAKLETTSTDSSKEIPLLGQLITEKQSTSLVKDVDRSIGLLQKLLKSKKYDAATKKRYIKKIVSKIVDNKYNEDSTTSSELFVPKKQDNVSKHMPQIPKLTVKTFSDEFLPNEGPSNSKQDVVSSPENPASSLDTGGGISSLEKQQNTSSGSYQSWKEDKTLSEKVLEQKRGQGDQLVKFAMKERQNQIAWINDEISHLSKLKGLLEKKTKKTTTVYMLSNVGSVENSSSNSDVKRNYVIQTELSESTSSGIPENYNLYEESGKTNYQVKELAARPENGSVGKKIVGDIEVVSDDNTTNIRVKTRRIDPDMMQTQRPNLGGVGRYDTFPKSKAEEVKIWSHGKQELNKRPQINEQADAKYSYDLPLKNTKPTPTTKCMCGGKCFKSTRNIFRKDSDDASGSRSVKSNENSKCKENKAVSNTHLQKTTDLKICSCNEQNETNIKQSAKNRLVSSSNENVNQFSSATSSSSSKKLTTVSSSDKSVKCKCGCKCMMRERETISRTSEFEERKEVLDTESDNKKYSSKRDTIEPKKSTTDTELQAEYKHNKEVQTSLYTTEDTTQSRSGRMQSSTLSGSSSSSSETITSVSGSIKSCLCCKRKNVTSKHLYALKKKLSDQTYPLCRPCYHRNKKGNYTASHFNNPEHVCNCYTIVQTETLDEIKNTINDLNELGDEYCTCLKVDNRKSSDSCKYCKTKLKATSKNRNGIAYMLTFENEILPEEKEKKKQKKKRHLEEIKVKIPVSYKKRKEKENKRKKEKQTHDSDETSTNEAKKKPTYSLQEFLCKNRPDFLQVAEDRRKVVNETKTQREETTDYKKLVFLKHCQQDRDKNGKRLFSAKEMKDITRRNYKKLPEVQQRLVDNKEKQLRQANRLIADTFNRKLRENVLRGKRNLPTDVNVINL